MNIMQICFISIYSIATINNDPSTGVRNLKEITLKTPVKSLCYSNGVVWVGGVGQIGKREL